MKPRNLILAAYISFSLVSCSPTYYQVYKAAPTENVNKSSTSLVYEDDNCKISYDLWGDGGRIGFLFYNKTDKSIFINLEESFFVLNGISYNYFKNRVFTSTTGIGVNSSIGTTVSGQNTWLNFLNSNQSNNAYVSRSSGLSTLSGYSVSYNEERIITVPSRTSKLVSEYSINQVPFRHCDIVKYPTPNDARLITFTKETSPLVFSNRIKYSIEDDEKEIDVLNEFYVNEISNHNSKDILELRYDEFCGNKSSVSTYYFKSTSPDMFFIRYNSGQTAWINLY